MRWGLAVKCFLCGESPAIAERLDAEHFVCPCDQDCARTSQLLALPHVEHGWSCSLFKCVARSYGHEIPARWLRDARVLTAIPTAYFTGRPSK